MPRCEKEEKENVNILNLLVTNDYDDYDNDNDDDRCGGDRVEGAAFRDEFPSVWQNFKWDEGSRLGSLELDNLWCFIRSITCRKEKKICRVLSTKNVLCGR